MPALVSRRSAVAPLFCRPWTLNGISPRLIESHYEHNYGGAVARLNALAEELAALDPAATPPDVISRLKRDEIAALNSTAARAVLRKPRRRRQSRPGVHGRGDGAGFRLGRSLAPGVRRP